MCVSKIPLLIATCVLFSYSVIGQAVSISYNKYVKSKKTAITVELNDSGITSLRVVNASSRNDTYEPTRIFNGQKIVILDVNILKSGGAENVFYIDAYKETERVSETLFSPSGKVTIKMLDDAETQSEEDPGETPPTSGSNRDGFSESAEPNVDANTPTTIQTPKIRLQAAPDVGNQSTVSLQIFPRNLKPAAGKYIIRIKNGDRSREKEIAILPDGDKVKLKSPQTVDIPLTEGENKIKVFPKIDEKEHEDWGDELTVNCNTCDENRSSTSARAVIGFEQIGASASGSKQSPFLDFYFDTPFSFGNKTAFSIWGNVRLSSIPVQSFVSLANLNAFPTFIDEGTKNSNNLTQSFDFLVGVERKLPIKGVFGSGFFPGKSSIYLIAGVGAINPLSPEKTAEIFKVPMKDGAITPEFKELFPEADGKTNIAFVSPERDRFFRQYYGGLRLKTFFYDGDESKPKNLFPAMVDITVGQNESITGTLRGLVGRLDGSTPLPLRGADFLYIFGSAQMRFGRKVNQNVSSFFLERADSTATITNTNTVVVPIDRYPQTISNRDRFRLGIGIDLFRVFKKDETKQ